MVDLGTGVSFNGRTRPNRGKQPKEFPQPRCCCGNMFPYDRGPGGEAVCGQCASRLKREAAPEA